MWWTFGRQLKVVFQEKNSHKNLGTKLFFFLEKTINQNNLLLNRNHLKIIFPLHYLKIHANE